MRIPSILLAYSAITSATTFFPTVFAPGTNLDGALLNAANQGFYTSIEGPSTYCPSSVKDCPKVQGTLVFAGMSGMAVGLPFLLLLFLSCTTAIPIFPLFRTCFLSSSGPLRTIHTTLTHLMSP